ncbi:hypothetical protein [Streptomyces sp. NPDC001781]
MIVSSGMGLAPRAGMPALAVGPVAGGAKVTAQARARGRPERHDTAALDRWWDWCPTSGRALAAPHRRRLP